MATDLAEAGDKGEQVMDTFTDDERREVAEKLRHASHTDANLDVTIAIAILETVGEVHRPIAAVVADLIDPTCEVKNDNRYTSDFDYVCRACGEHFSTCDRPNYCPGCGARVVDDE